MPYYIINKQAVFLSWARSKELNELVSKDKDSSWRISSVIHGHQASEEKSKLVYEVLNKKYIDDPDDFKSAWVEFDLKGKEASKNTWDLLYDYCHYFGYAFLSDLRDYSEKMSADFKGELFSEPMGKVFALNHLMKPTKWWWKYIHKMKGRNVRVVINTEKVKRIQGNLEKFIIYTDNCEITCSQSIFTLMPN